MKNRTEYVQLLSGKGIELGALHRPVEAPHLSVQYIDRLSKSDLLNQYPELQGYPIVEPDIIDDAELLTNLPDNSQDFVIANHVIEHMANPILSLKNWIRVLKKGGRAFLAVPNKLTTFDKDRPITPISHIIDDFRNPSAERDFEHFREFALFVSCRTFNVKPESEAETFAKHLFNTNYSIHYHVWDFPSFSETLVTCLSMIEPYGATIVASMPPIEDEFIFVIERTK